MAAAVALLRNAARRIDGRALKRTQGAVEANQRLLILKKEDAPIGEAKDRAASCFVQIQKHKEYLYSLIAEAEKRNYGFPVTIKQQNAKLVELLAEQVQARPNDKYWRWCRIMNKINTGIHSTGVMFLGSVLGLSFVYFVDHKEKKIALEGGISMSSEDSKPQMATN